MFTARTHKIVVSEARANGHATPMQKKLLMNYLTNYRITLTQERLALLKVEQGQFAAFSTLLTEIEDAISSGKVKYRQTRLEPSAVRQMLTEQKKGVVSDSASSVPNVEPQEKKTRKPRTKKSA